ncbi:MAG: translation initiation factor, aIF-2BI family, partial [Pseudonocardia sp.]|nr:translation initiation factor, aIF-2BI family [Pseudonocardia sp.]
MLPRTIDWVDDRIVVVDQTALPRLCLTTLSTVDELVDAIGRLVVRGAPALGVAGAMGVALAAGAARRSAHSDAPRVLVAAERIAAARPTAVNLRWGAQQAVAALAA